MHASLLLFHLVSLVAAGPAALPGCPNNACYPVLTGPIKDIAQGFCSYYLKYPRSTTTTVKTTVTSTSSCTIKPTTLVLTDTTSVTAITSITVTQTIPGPVVSATITAAQGDVRKRVPVPGGFTPPKGAGPDWKPPQLSAFPPAVVSAACSCIATPTTTTFTTTSTGTTTVPNPCTKTTITTTAGTVTNTVFITVTDAATTILPATTVIVTVAPPAATCSYPLNDQRGVRGVKRPGSQGAYYTETGVANAQACYNNAKSLTDYFGGATNLQSYAFASDSNPGSPDGPGTCYGYQTRSCDNLLIDPVGNLYGGDTSLPY